MVQPAAWPATLMRTVLSGPGLAELVQEALYDIAVSIHEGDWRAERWTDYLLAVSRSLDADGDVSEEEAVDLGGKVADAGAALLDDLGTDLYLDPAEARLIAHQLDDVAGRVGTVKP
jgi:propanediol dehydratase large subunit